MSKLASQLEDDIFSIRSITLEISRAFREKYVQDVRLIADAWDLKSEHFGLYIATKLIGTYRLVMPLNGRLPISEHGPTLAVDPEDQQVGRFVTSRRLWTVSAGAALFSAYVEQIRRAQGRTYVATAERGPISAERYESLGFVRTGITYKDARYDAPMMILVKFRT